MDIKEFIKQTIIGISEAVIEINQEKGKTGLSVCPVRISGINRTDERGTIVQNIDFDLCVEVSEDSKADAGLRISIVGAGVESNNSSSSKSNIKFTLPVAFPSANYKTYQQ